MQTLLLQEVTQSFKFLSIQEREQKTLNKKTSKANSLSSISQVPRGELWRRTEELDSEREQR